MNKRFWYICVIIVLLVGICVVEQLMVSNYLNTMKNEFLSLSSFVSNKENINTNEILKKVENIETTWNGYQTALCFFVNLKDVEEIGVELTKMKVYVNENNITDFKASLQLCVYHIESYDNTMGISFENIF